MAPVQERQWADIYVGITPCSITLRPVQRRYRKDHHVLLDLDHGGSPSIEALENSDFVRRRTNVLNTSPEKIPGIWKVEGMTPRGGGGLEPGNGQENSMAIRRNGFERYCAFPDFATEVRTDFYVQARAESTQTYHLRDFKLPKSNSPDAPRLSTKNPPANH